jgi:hypothetical protein
MTLSSSYQDTIRTFLSDQDMPGLYRSYTWERGYVEGRVPAGSAAYVAPDQVKGYRNSATSTSTILSFVDPAWTPEKTEMLA